MSKKRIPITDQEIDLIKCFLIDIIGISKEHINIHTNKHDRNYLEEDEVFTFAEFSESTVNDYQKNRVRSVCFGDGFVGNPSMIKFDIDWRKSNYTDDDGKNHLDSESYPSFEKCLMSMKDEIKELYDFWLEYLE